MEYSKSISYLNFLSNIFVLFLVLFCFYILDGGPILFNNQKKSISIFKNGKPSIGDMNHYCFCISHGNEIQ